MTEPLTDADITSFLQLLATTLSTSGDNYLSLLDDLLGATGAPGIDLPQARGEAAGAAATLAQLARHAQAAQSILGAAHGASARISEGLPLLRALGDSYAMVAGASDMDDLDGMPLVMPDELEHLRTQAAPLVSRWAVPLDQLGG